MGIIPARGGSKGIPRKNIALLGGKPLIWYAIRAAQESKLLDACIISTDDPEIAHVARSYGADAPFLRPKKYAKDRSRDIEFLSHALAWVKKHRGWEPEWIVILQPTSPARTGKDIDAVVRFALKENCDSVRTVIRPGAYNPFKMWRMSDPRRGIMEPLFSKSLDAPRQELPDYCLQVGIVYATRARFVRDGAVWGSDVRGYLMPSEKFTDIDEPDDLAVAEETMRKMKLL